MAKVPISRHFSVAVPLGYAVTLPEAKPSIAVIIHIFYAEQAAEIADYLRNIRFRADIFISTDTPAKADAIGRVFAGWTGGKGRITLVPNRGRDIAPLLVTHRHVHDDYEFVLHIHSKASRHVPALEHWRGYIFETLLGSPEIVESIFELFARLPQLGFLAPQHWEPMAKQVGWAGNFESASAIARTAGFTLSPDKAWDFPSGSMFWARTAALKPLLGLDLEFSSFPTEAGQTDATPAHAIERLFFAAGEAAGYGWLHIARPDFFHDRHGIVTISAAEDLRGLLRSRDEWAAPTAALVTALRRRRGDGS